MSSKQGTFGTINFFIYIHRVLKQVHPETSITKKSMHVLNDMLNSFGRRAAEIAAHTTSAALNGQERRTITARNVQSAVRIVLPGELAKHAVSEGDKALSKFRGTKGSAHGGKGAAAKSGLQFPPARCGKFFKVYKKRLGETVGVYTAAVLEYLAAEVLELAGNAARDNKKQQISPRHLTLAVRNDEELNKLFSGGIIHDGGNIPHIHANLLPRNNAKEGDKNTAKPKRKSKKKGAKKQKSSSPVVGGKKAKAPHRFKPGTVALREIRKFQKSTNTLIRKQPFYRVVRELSTVKDGKVRFRSTALEILQSWVEGYLIQQFQNANFAALHANRVTVMPKDLQLVRRIHA